MANDETGKAMIDHTALFLLAYGIKSLAKSSKRVKGIVENGQIYYDFIIDGNRFTEEELQLIVDLGGCVEDVMVNHKVYGKVSAPLNIKNRRDVQAFLKNLESGKSTPLLKVTSGYHFHRVSADESVILDEIEEALRQKNFLTEVFDYEME